MKKWSADTLYNWTPAYAYAYATEITLYLFPKKLIFRFLFIAVLNDSFAHVAIDQKDIFFTIGCGGYARLLLSSSVGKR